MLAAQPTKQFVTVEQVAALAVYLCSDAAQADHRRAPADRRRLDRGVSVTPADVRKIALAFPGGNEQMRHGGRVAHFYVGRKFFTWVRPEENSLVVKVDSIDERDALIESDPKLFHITDHYRDYPAVLMRLNRATPKLVKGMLDRRFQAIATRKLLAEWTARADADARANRRTA